MWTRCAFRNRLHRFRPRSRDKKQRHCRPTRPLTKSSLERGCVGVEGHQPQHPRSFRALRLAFGTAALREDDFVNGLVSAHGSAR